VTTALLYLAAFVWLFHYTWVLFGSIMNARRVRDMGKLSNTARWMTYLSLGIGYPLDVLFMLLFCVMLLDPPREITLSKKLWRLSNGGGWWAWQCRRAQWWRANLLDWFDHKGEHRG
jgi:hypothetical protein